MFRWFKRKMSENRPAVGREYLDYEEQRHNKRLLAAGAENLYQLLKKFPVDPAAVLRKDDMGNRITAAQLLRNFPSAKTAEALQNAIAHDPEYLVRYPATKSLLLIYGYPYEEVNQHVRLIAPKLGNKMPAPTPEAIDMIQQLIHDRSIGLAG